MRVTGECESYVNVRVTEGECESYGRGMLELREGDVRVTGGECKSYKRGCERGNVRVGGQPHFC